MLFNKNKKQHRDVNVKIANNTQEESDIIKQSASANDSTDSNNLQFKNNKNKRNNNRKLIVTVEKYILAILLICLTVVAIFMAIKFIKYLNNNYQTSLNTTKSLMAEAALQTQQYDYDGAIDTYKTIPGYQTNDQIKQLIKKNQELKSQCTAYPVSQIEHVFCHTLVVDTDKAFNQGNALDAGWKQWMITVSEFKKIIQKMYDNGYVLVSIHDLVKEVTNDDGSVSFVENDSLLLPQGKKAFVLSLDDLSYYHAYEGRGTAMKLVIKDGIVTNEYTNSDGSVVYGSYDCVPILNDFVDEHPDFSYHGAKGIIALTGYNGVLGYRTDIAYKTGENLDSAQKAWLNSQDNFNYDKECQAATEVADAIKKDGWEFASHTWGHIKIGDVGMNYLINDTEKWDNYVRPIVGDTDIIVFAHGQDINSIRTYSESDERFTYLESKGFRFYCNVDSVNPYVYSIGSNYLRMGRLDLDGYRLWNDAHNNSSKTSNLFDAIEVLDDSRTDMPSLN